MRSQTSYRLFKAATQSSDSEYRWVLPTDQESQVLWTDADGTPYLAKGRFKGLRIPATDMGGPVQFIVDGSDGEVALEADDVVGIRPAGA